MTRDCAVGIAVEILEIRSGIASIKSQSWPHDENGESKAACVRDLEECCEIAEAALMRDGFDVERLLEEVAESL